MSKFINLLSETWSVINEQDPAMMDPAMMAPAPPSGPEADAAAMDTDGPENEPTNLREEEIKLVRLCQKCLRIDPQSLDTNRDLEPVKALVLQDASARNADEIKKGLEIIVNSYEPGDVDAEAS